MMSNSLATALLLLIETVSSIPSSEIFLKLAHMTLSYSFTILLFDFWQVITVHDSHDIILNNIIINRILSQNFDMTLNVL